MSINMVQSMISDLDRCIKSGGSTPGIWGHLEYDLKGIKDGRTAASFSEEQSLQLEAARELAHQLALSDPERDKIGLGPDHWSEDAAKARVVPMGYMKAALEAVLPKEREAPPPKVEVEYEKPEDRFYKSDAAKVRVEGKLVGLIEEVKYPGGNKCYYLPGRHLQEFLEGLGFDCPHGDTPQEVAEAIREFLEKYAPAQSGEGDK